VSSPHDVIDVVIDREKKAPQMDVQPAGAGVGDFGPARINRVLLRGARLPGGC
jgi:hypothetical protein